MDYNLIDIHCHSNLSYDAFENLEKGSKFCIPTIFKNTKIKMICITDHNVFIREKYIDNQKQFNSMGIVCLPGMELTIEGVHWIIIMDDNQVNETNINEEFCKKLLKLISINYKSYKTSDLKTAVYKAKELIELFDEFGINYIAIPHLDKDKGIFKSGGVSQEKIELFLNYIRDNIVYGFETKLHDEFFASRIAKINRNIEILQGTDSEKIDKLYNQLNNLKSVKKLSSAFVYGSDFHGKPNEKYSDFENQLFYMKAECTFQGLRLSLIDYDSRIFSVQRYEKYTKKQNKILESVTINVNGSEQVIKFGDGLNSIIGSKGTGKSYLLKTMLNENQNYAKSDIYDQIKLISLKLKGEDSKEFFDKQLDVDSISQKNSKIDETNNIFDILSEAPYDTEKFVDKIRSLNTESTRENDVDSYFYLVNDCLNSYIKLYRKKSEAFDYSFLNTYNSFYQTSGTTFQLIKIFDKHISFSDRIIRNKNEENGKLSNFNRIIEEFNEGIKFVKELKKYEFNDFENLQKDIDLIKIANSKRIEKNNNDIQRINMVESFILKMKDNAMKNDTNTSQYYSVGFKNLSQRITQLFNLMNECLNKSRKIESLNENEIVDKENISINRDNISINLNIDKKLDITSKNISELQDVFKNYNNIEKCNIKYKSLFKDFGENYINNVYPYKDGRVTKGEYNGYDLFIPNIIPNITIIYNGEGKDLSKLSPGEKADILLDLILDPNSSKILIIDQPEDDLDNETIYKKVVNKLRTIKMRRQIILISHNANVVINGDSDKIIVCMKNEKKYQIISDTMESTIMYKYSSINTPEITDTILNISTMILDGGMQALSKRVKKIGYKQIFLKEDLDEVNI